MSTSQQVLGYDVEQVWLPASERLLEWGEDFHDLLLGDRIRMLAFREALFEAVRPGSTVLDLGTGTGILARWALEAGAARAYGLDLNGEILADATARLTAAGLGDRFHPVHGLSFEVTLPERVDLIVSETIGNLADNEGFVEILDDARQRFLAPGGRMMPQRVESYLVPVAAERAHSQVRDGVIADGDEGWQRVLRERGGRDGFDLYYDVVLPRSAYLGPPRLLRRYEFDRPNSATYCETLAWTVHDPGLFTGFKGYFVASLSDSVALDISGDDTGDPGRRTSSDSWKHCYLPVGEPVPVRRDDRIRLVFSRTGGPPGAPFAQAYRWQGAVVRDGQAVARFDHSTRPAA